MVPSVLDESEEVGIDLVLLGLADAVGSLRVDLQSRVLHQLGGHESRGADRHDLVIIAMQDQGRDVDLLEIGGVVDLGKLLYKVDLAFYAPPHAPDPEK